jgi:polyketide biosynthesis 3-hydroxy-3-methylglutaryl-CoA synthase-like enzyme PksG
VGNIYSATVYLALCGLLDAADLSVPRRLGLFSYGSGCCGEFFSGVAGPEARARLGALRKAEHLAQRVPLTLPQYEQLIDAGLEWVFGVKDKEVDLTPYRDLYDRALAGRGLLVLRRIRGYHREYEWS